MDSIFDCVIVEANHNITTGTPFQSETFDHYLMTKYWVCQHKPM